MTTHEQPFELLLMDRNISHKLMSIIIANISIILIHESVANTTQMQVSIPKGFVELVVVSIELIASNTWTRIKNTNKKAGIFFYRLTRSLTTREPVCRTYKNTRKWQRKMIDNGNT